MEKICPILQAGKMISCLTTTSGVHVKGDIQGYLNVLYDKDVSCMKENCTWWNDDVEVCLIQSKSRKIL